MKPTVYIRWLSVVDRVAIRTVVLSLLALLATAPAMAQQRAAGSWREEVQRLRGGVTTRATPARAGGKRELARLSAGRRVPPGRVASIASILGESEPNNDVASADSVAMGDQATGVINPQGDVDTWFLDLVAGQFVSLDVDAKSIGSLLDPTLALIAPDGRSILAFNDDFDGFDSRISYRVRVGGRYYLAIRSFGDLGFPEFRYAITVGLVTCAPGETEREPNDGPATAAPFAIGDTVAGEICAHNDDPRGDVDYWAFTAQAGTAIELDVDASEFTLMSDPFLALFGSDGTTLLASNDDADGPDSRLQASITATGTYYATVSTLTDPGGNPFPYRLHGRPITPGPGDPVAVRATGLGLPLGLAMGSTGDLFATDLTGNRVARISAQGAVTTFVAGIPNPTGLAFDAFDHLLVVSFDESVVYRVTPEGQATRFITDAGIPFWIAVAPDGRIWLTDLSDRSLRRYSRMGRFETRFDLTGIGGSGPGPLAIGPSGEPYVSNGTEIWRLTGSGPRRVLTSPFLLWAFAFDVAGHIYAPAPVGGRIVLFDGAGTAVADPFALGPDAPQAVAFGRSESGATLARLFATDPQVGRVIEMNPAGVAHRGLPVGFVPAPFTPEVAAATLLGAGGLSAADRAFLDALGNHNGRYDVGDLQAYLRSVDGLPGATTAIQRPGSDR